MQPTDEMIDAYNMAWRAYWAALGHETPEGGPTVVGHGREADRAGLAAVLALVERDYHIEPRPSAGSATRCGCPPELCYGRASRRPGQECGAVLDRGAP